MNTEARRAIEAILMVADSPIEPQLLAQITEVPVAEVERICSDLAAEYEASERGFVIQRVAGGYRYQSHPEMAAYVERFVLDGQSAKMSAAALETLAIVAYKQPISRAQIASIRGVNVDGVIRTLQSRGYVDEVGRDPGPGNAIMYGTTPAFLEKLGLDNVDQLPPLGAFVPGADVVEQLERTLRVDPLGAAEAAPPAESAPDDTSPDVSAARRDEDLVVAAGALAALAAARADEDEPDDDEVDGDEADAVAADEPDDDEPGDDEADAIAADEIDAVDDGGLVDVEFADPVDAGTDEPADAFVDDVGSAFDDTAATDEG